MKLPPVINCEPRWPAFHAFCDGPKSASRVGPCNTPPGLTGRGVVQERIQERCSRAFRHGFAYGMVAGAVIAWVVVAVNAWMGA